MSVSAQEETLSVFLPLQGKCHAPHLSLRTSHPGWGVGHRSLFSGQCSQVSVSQRTKLANRVDRAAQSSNEASKRNAAAHGGGSLRQSFELCASRSGPGRCTPS
eukprot:scaffold45913_cov22-Tisochrysis_lutea.AAC.2